MGPSAVRHAASALAALFVLAIPPAAAADGPACAARRFEDVDLTACVIRDVGAVRLFLNDGSGAPYGDFAAVAASLDDGERLALAMNAGMYHADRAPVGLYVENGERRQRLNENDGPGNFHMKPNGVFWIEADGAGARARVGTPKTFKKAKGVRHATQSGPMLVIDGALHPRFIPGSDSLKRRNGVGVRADGAVVFAVADAPINFDAFARFFRDEMKTPDTLFLDGSISRLYAPAIGRNDRGAKMGPIVGVVVADDAD